MRTGRVNVDMIIARQYKTNLIGAGDKRLINERAYGVCCYISINIPSA